jgi:hypothetical protein
VDDLEEELSSARIEDEDGTIDWLGRQITFKRLQEWKEMWHSKCSPDAIIIPYVM